MFYVRSPIAQTRELLELSERHGCAAPLPRDGVGGGHPVSQASFLCGDSCTRFGAAGQGWHQPGEASAACHGFI